MSSVACDVQSSDLRVQPSQKDRWWADVGGFAADKASAWIVAALARLKALQHEISV
jgi:hypothetical protein